jgi:hypothetical protein
MVIAPLLVFMFRDKSAALALLLVPCAIVPWFLPKELLGTLMIGFYCWNGSYFLMSIGCVFSSIAFAAIDDESHDRDRIGLDKAGDERGQPFWM